jgi:glucosylceramidase
MNAKSITPIVCCLCWLSPLAAHAQKDVSVWLTTADHASLFQEQAPLPFSAATPANPSITIDPSHTYQTMDGFGYALTGGSAQLILHMDPAKRDALLHELFDTNGTHIGVSYLRLTIGASDMNDYVFSYDDLPAGQTDPAMARFSIDPDKADVIPVMKQILAIDPRIKILASPWSAPLWMKTSGEARGGVLKPEFFPAYATYFVKYIQAMKAEGIDIDAITVQNEPLNEKNTPSMLMLDSEQDVFIRDNLGPAFKTAGIKTKIVLYDHNLDHPLYPLSILRDAKANKYIDGTGFHLYGGTVDAMTQVHDEFPRKNLYFTEQSITSRPGVPFVGVSRPEAHVIIAVSRNWSKNILLWNLAADPNAGPHTNEGGCGGCFGAITIDGDNVTRNVAYYTLAHASKFVRPGSSRIDSNTTDTLPNVAFKTPDGKLVLIVSNPGDATQTFDVHAGSNVFTYTLKAGSVATCVW